MEPVGLPIVDVDVPATWPGFTQQLYRQVLPASVNEPVDRLWQSVTLQRHAKSIVSNPLPHHLMAEALGPALEF